jgi:hypothetical protein
LASSEYRVHEGLVRALNLREARDKEKATEKAKEKESD